MRYDNLRKTKRDNSIRAFARKHKKWSHQELSIKFVMSRSNISRILKEVKNGTHKGNSNQGIL